MGNVPKWNQESRSLRRNGTIRITKMEESDRANAFDTGTSV